MTARNSRGMLSEILLVLMLILPTSSVSGAPHNQELDPAPPEQVVKLIFIHHSTGENWLSDNDGGLGRALDQNNYFVSDTNYGWGPGNIGDRTDIPDWLEWFRGEASERILQALYTEHGQNADYTRTRSDPGGENQIVLLKSCFPNSNLEGRPDDPPTPGTDWTVGNAKYIYNQLLEYFATRPDKLFIVITAPPVSDPSLAANARAFNLWLVRDWLRENDYPLRNVAVYDFYNVLTGPDNHHRFANGAIEHIFTPGMDTSFYSSSPDDDHPSQAGNRKATQEFVPMLNVFYNRWRAEGPSQPPPQSTAVGAVTGDSEPGPSAVTMTDWWIDDFESALPTDSAGWEPFHGEAPGTVAACAPSTTAAISGAHALQITVELPAGSWATCALFYDQPRDWSAGEGISFQVQADRIGLAYDVNIHSGLPDQQETYAARMEIHQQGLDGWERVDLAWGAFKRVAWEENAGSPFTATNQVIGLAIGFDGGDDGFEAGTVWVDDIQVYTAGAAPIEVPEPVGEPQEEGGGGLPCAGALTLPLGVLGIFLIRRRNIPAA